MTTKAGLGFDFSAISLPCSAGLWMAWHPRQPTPADSCWLERQNMTCLSLIWQPRQAAVTASLFLPLIGDESGLASEHVLGPIAAMACTTIEFPAARSELHRLTVTRGPEFVLNLAWHSMQARPHLSIAKAASPPRPGAARCSAIKQ